ncbi:unnamed protein product [Ectocarpus sp. 6 AP-2014]
MEVTSVSCHSSLFPVLLFPARFDVKHEHEHPRRTRHTTTTRSEVIYRCRQPHNKTPDNGFSMPSLFWSHTVHTNIKPKKATHQAQPPLAFKQPPFSHGGVFITYKICKHRTMLSDVAQLAKPHYHLHHHTTTPAATTTAVICINATQASGATLRHKDMKQASWDERNQQPTKCEKHTSKIGADTLVLTALPPFLPPPWGTLYNLLHGIRKKLVDVIISRLINNAGNENNNRHAHISRSPAWRNL